MRLALIAYLVRDYDEAVAWLRDALGFALEQDSDPGDGKRWVVMAPPGGGARLLLARASGPAQTASVGDQAAGRVFLFLETNDIARERARMEEAGVAFEEPVRREPYGQVCVFRDLYGNRWDLIEPAAGRG